MTLLGRAGVLFLDDEPAGLAFGAGTIALVFGLTPPSEGVDWLPGIPRWVRRYWKRMVVGAIIVAALLIAFAVYEAGLRQAASARAAIERAEQDRQIAALRNAAIKNIEAEYRRCIQTDPTSAKLPDFLKGYGEMSCSMARDQALSRWR